jgi:hypothetical protein
MAFILTQPNTGASSSNQAVIDNGIIPANTTVTLDSMGLSETNTIKWTIELIDNINLKIRSFEIFAINMFDINIAFNKYSITGKLILHDVNVIINGSNINFNITNNENVDLNYKFTRTQL